VFVALCVLGAGLGYGYLRFRFGQIHKIDITKFLQQDDPGDPMNVLLVGSDSRARLTGVDAVHAGKNLVEGERSDTIMILHVDPAEKKAAILSVPRDLLVTIYGENRTDRVNTAFSLGGASKLIGTITQNLGIKVNHYVEVDFVGFKSIVDSVGGVKMYVPAPARDTLSGLDVKNPGCITFNGNQALAWARSRHYEYYESGRWREDPRGDLGRIQRQQELIRRMLKTAVSAGRTNPLELNRLIGIGIKNVTIDSAMSTKDIFGLARRFKSLDADAVDMLTLPTTAAMVRLGGQDASVLRLDAADAQAYIDRLNGVASPSRSSAPTTAGGPLPLQQPDARVRILNGTGADGLANRVGAQLEGAGFTVADKGDADSFRYTRTVIRYAPGELSKAQLLQQYLEGPSQLQQDATLKTVDLALVVGSDYSGVRSRTQNGAASPSATTSTIPKPEPAPAPRGAPPQPSC
jgi:LCP family protein required for cell wall assembly